jgi:hypothetical protein
VVSVRTDPVHHLQLVAVAAEARDLCASAAVAVDEVVDASVVKSAADAAAAAEAEQEQADKNDSSVVAAAVEAVGHIVVVAAAEALPAVAVDVAVDVASAAVDAEAVLVEAFVQQVQLGWGRGRELLPERLSKTSY